MNPLLTPGLPELLVLLVSILVPIALGVWVRRDAADRGSEHDLAWGLAVIAGWILGAILGGVVIVALYFAVRDEVGSTAPPTFGEADMDDDAQVLGQPLGRQRGPDEDDEDASTEASEPASAADSTAAGDDAVAGEATDEE